MLKEDQTVEQRVVATRETIAGWTPVETGVKPGEKVVISGMSKLTSGMKVTQVEATGNEDLDPAFQQRIKE